MYILISYYKRMEKYYGQQIVRQEHFHQHYLSVMRLTHPRSVSAVGKADARHLTNSFIVGRIWH